MPQTGYGADRLADDVLEVIDTLRLEKPVLAGHSIAGEELSSIGSRHPEKVSGLVYLDAGYGYALYDPSRGDAELDAMEVRNKLDALLASPGQKSLIGKLLQTDLPQLQKTLKSHLQDLEDAGPMPVMPTGKEFSPPKAILAGRQKFTEIKVPALAIYALPNGPVPARIANAAKSFETIVPIRASSNCPRRITTFFDPMRKMCCAS
ncbi:MAG: alpha/beta hydrolase [Bryobacteraceae bacterium]|nr:alpha/beta hydrolase [Bryobacteraceae bacterium]